MKNLSRGGRIVGLLALVLLFSGCSSWQQDVFDSGFEQPREPLAQWRVQGRVGIRAEGQAESANIFWRLQGDDYNLRLSGPFGAGTVIIEGDAEHVVLKQRNQPDVSAVDAEALLLRHTGWQLPVSSMVYWLQGLASPELPVDDSRRLVVEADTENTVMQDLPLAMLQQGDWHIEFQRYSRIESTVLPSKVVITHPSLRITLIVSQWQL
ncbi:Outer-membrane lipoprotein LolB [Sinobacterium norvegicum]|uniref:Outer-membrane lipoprotein LolB n=1 Tax=Sinobacterium norvegicum TaxID=1641715 RepID=A0ABM9ADZ8_9GAMM|nr:lipoprotein insertase outer membrane protein LolB [Sinobacterium norvegicum]CAH0991423.1 Outer-membrane lipoprotein LolB [Sinobacterium norvegicum]